MAVQCPPSLSLLAQGREGRTSLLRVRAVVLTPSEALLNWQQLLTEHTKADASLAEAVKE